MDEIAFDIAPAFFARQRRGSGAVSGLVDASKVARTAAQECP